jgi:HPt (histidine-containing phosphotransfer) domain-containing protein
MNDYVSKPIDPYLLYDVLLKWITLRYAGPDTELGNTLPILETGEIIDDFPELPGVDVESGIMRVGRDRQFYRRMLLKFKESHFDDVNKIRQALKNDDVDAAIRLAHTLKGLAGSLGAEALRKASEELEKTIKNNDDSKLGLSMDAFAAELTLVISSISLFDQTISNSSGIKAQNISQIPEINNREISTIFAKLKALMTDNDTASWDLLADLADRLKGSRFDIDLGPVRQALEQYDFDNGLEQLRELVDSLNLSESED